MQNATEWRPGYIVAAVLAMVVAAFAFGASVQAQDGPTVQVGGNEELGEFLVGPDQMTLYIFEQDEEGVSNCSGDCAENWPPLTVSEGEEPTVAEGVDGELDTIERDDGSLQVTLDGQPLYYWAQDEEPGDATGQGVQDVWFVVEASATGGGTGNGADDGAGNGADESADEGDREDDPGAPDSGGAGLAGTDGGGMLSVEVLSVLGGALIAAGAGFGALARRRQRA